MGNHIRFCKIISACGLFIFNETLFLALQKGNGIAGVDYLKVKNDVTYWKTIPDRSQIHFAPNLFLLRSSTVERTRSGVFIANFKEISHIVLEFLLLTLNKVEFD